MTAQAHTFTAQRLLLYRREEFLLPTLIDDDASIDDTGDQKQTGKHEPDPTRTAFGYRRVRAYVFLKRLIGVLSAHALTAVLDLFITTLYSPKSPDFIGITVDGIEGLDIGYWILVIGENEIKFAKR